MSVYCDRCGKKGPIALAITGMEMVPLWSRFEYNFFNCGPQEKDQENIDLCPDCSKIIRDRFEREKK